MRSMVEREAPVLAGRPGAGDRTVARAPDIIKAHVMNRQEFLKTVTPHLVAEVRMYTTAEGGRQTAALLGWGCPCMVSLTEPRVGYDAWPILTDEPLLPGSRRRLGFYFLSGDEAAEVIRTSGHFYLWEGHAVGEAEVVG